MASEKLRPYLKSSRCLDLHRPFLNKAAKINSNPKEAKKLIIGGNWKCNGSLSSVTNLINDVLNKATFDPFKVDVVVSPVDLHIGSVKSMIKNKHIKISA